MLRGLAARLAKGEALSEAEIAAARVLIKTGRIPLIGCRWVAKGALRLVPFVGWALLAYDAYTLTPGVAEALGRFLWAEPDAQAKISFLVPRATRHVLPDGTVIEYGDEILGPKTRYLEKWMTERLPTLPTTGLRSDSVDEPYKAAADPDYFEAFEEKKQFALTHWPKFDLGVSFADLNVRKAQGRTRWGEWRNTVATKWFRVDHPGPESIPISLVWWRDYSGRECRVMAWKDQVIIEPEIDFTGILSGLGLAAH